MPSVATVGDGVVDPHTAWPLISSTVPLIVNKRIQNAVTWVQSQIWQNDLIHFQGKPFNVTVIQVYAPTTNAEETEVEQFYEDLQDLPELTPKKDALFIIRH